MFFLGGKLLLQSLFGVLLSIFFFLFLFRQLGFLLQCGTALFFCLDGLFLFLEFLTRVFFLLFFLFFVFFLKLRLALFFGSLAHQPAF